MDEITPVTIGDLLERSTDIDGWVTPIDPSLKTGLWWGAGGIVASIPIGFLFTSTLAAWSYSGFFMFLGPLAVFLLSLLRSPVGITVNVIAAVLIAILYWHSDGFVADKIVWHKLGMGLVALGALDIFVVTLPVAIIALNVLVWVVLGVMALAIVFAVLFGAAAAR